jgi:hypothetical protein
MLVNDVMPVFPDKILHNGVAEEFKLNHRIVDQGVFIPCQAWRINASIASLSSILGCSGVMAFVAIIA